MGFSEHPIKIKSLSAKKKYESRENMQMSSDTAYAHYAF
jgi:hypothetical protein